MTFELREYQRDSLDAFYAYCGENDGNPLIVLPTGGGKSLVIAKLCQELIGELPDARICIVTHVKELIKQDYGELMMLWPEAPAGIYSAGLRRRDKDAQILFGGVQSMVNRIEDLGRFDLMIVDEAHLVPHSDDTSYRKLIDGLRLGRSSHMRVLGLTATAFRLDSGRLDRGHNHLFDAIVHEVPVRQLIDDGYLCRLVSKATIQQLDVSGVHSRGGDYIPHELELAVDQDWITEGACGEIVAWGKERRAWLVFCTGVRHATHIAEKLKELGVSCETIFGNTPREDRDRIIEAFRRGQLTCLVSVMVLGTGFNVPHVDLICLLRPTQSPGLFLQQVGRGLRNAPEKRDCLVLDFAGLVRRHGPIDTITADNIHRENREKTDNEDKCKVCPACQSQWPHGTLVCEDCGYVWPVKKQVPRHEAVADDTLTILSSNDPRWFKVTDMRCFTHRKHSTNSLTMRVEYSCGIATFKEWICLEHTGYAREKAVHWWNKHSIDGTPVPWSVADGVAMANAGLLDVPTEIRVQPDGQYHRITGRKFA